MANIKQISVKDDNNNPVLYNIDAMTVNGKTVNSNVPSNAVFTDTTYTFGNGTNGFTVTPSGGNPQTVTVTPSIADATTSTSGLMSSEDKTKLNGIATGAEVNQNAFSNIKVGSTTVAADAKTDTLEFVAGSNVTLTPDATNDKITIAATDTNTTYTFGNGTNSFTVTPSGGTAQTVTVTPSIPVATTSANGLMSSDDKTKLNGIASGAEVNQNAFSNVKVGSTTVAADGKTDTLELAAGNNITLTPDATNDKVTIAATDTTYSAGTGLALSGTTINHSNSVTAGTAKGDDSKTLTFGGTFTIPSVNYDAQGHITGKGTTTMTMPGNPDTHYTTHLYAGSGAAANAATSNGSTKLTVADNTTARDSIKIVGSGATSVSSDANGVITINSTDNNTTYNANNGVGLSGTTFYNSGVRSVATGSSNGTISVNTNGTATDVAVKGLGTAAYKNITDSYSSTGTDAVSGKAIAAALAGLPEPMVFKGSLGTGGTVTELPAAAAANKGFTYKVITAGTYASQAAKVGDTFISDGSAWVLIPSGDEPSGTVTSVTIKATSPIAIDSTAAITGSGTRTLSHANSGATAGSYGDSAAQTPGYGATFKVPYITVNATGHVTAISEHTVKIPASDNTNTTYTFAGGTNKFTVTPSGGTAQDITVTPSIANNVTGSGTSGYIAKFNGANTITNGPAFGSDTTKYLRNDGSWVVPPNTTYSANNGVGLSGTTFYNSGVRSIATGSSNGTISVNTNGTAANVAIKGLGSAAYTDSTAYAAASHNQPADTITAGYLNIQPENSPIIIPFMNNDIAFLTKRGGTAAISYDGTAQSIDLAGCFDGTPGYGYAIDPSNYTSIVIELTLHKVFTQGNTFYVDFGATGQRARGIKVEVINTNYTSDVQTQKYNNTNNGSGHIYCSVAHQPVGSQNQGGGFNKIRITFTTFMGTIFRIAQLGLYNYSSAGLAETYVNKGGAALFGTLYPFTNNGANLGTSSNYQNACYFTSINGVTVGSSPKFTDTTYNFSGTTFNSGAGSVSEHNANNAIKNGNYYYSSNGPTTTLGASTGDGALYVQAHSDSQVGQIAQDYRNGNLFTRGKNSGTQQAWRKVRYTDDTVAVANGGTGATTAAAARTNLGIGNVGTLSYGSDATKFLLNNGTWSTVVLPVNPTTKPTAVGSMQVEV